ncbi:MAG: transcription antitermination factor NusB, partial [Lachnospiraceae bacterium]
MMTKESTRAIVLDILLEVMEKGKFTHIVLRQALDKYGYLEKNERAFISRLANGTIEKCIELDYIINGYSSVKVNKMKPVIRNILRMTVYQLKYMDSVPASAACNEAVKLAQKKGFGQLKGFINGVSRNISRHIEEMVQYDDLSVKYS